MRYTKVLQRLYDWHKCVPDAFIWQILGPAKKKIPTGCVRSTRSKDFQIHVHT